ncbi:hypothetical protein BDD12DRAFT_909755 [Trichophaea hybrida]|nr:hypothetical protein BDD12DRAFT_909755 [Trichophaea hybrida]
MQLHGTPWLGESWSSNDILFTQKVITRRTRSTGNLPCQTCEPVIEHPFVRRTFDSEELVPLEDRPQPPEEPALIPKYDKSHFPSVSSWFEKRIEELRTQSTQPLSSIPRDPTSTVFVPTMDHTGYATAQQRIGELITYAGDYYGLMVSRCINGLDRPGGHGPPGASQNILDMKFLRTMPI